MAKPFRSDKRKKELQRLKKQEEKRLRRFGLKPPEDGTEETAPNEEGMTENEDSTNENEESTTEKNEAPEANDKAAGSD